MRQIRRRTSAEVVQRQHLRAVFEQSLAQMTTEETNSSGDHYPFGANLDPRQSLRAAP